MKASMTKQGMSPAIIPNKNHWYASIAFQRRWPVRSAVLFLEADG